MWSVSNAKDFDVRFEFQAAQRTAVTAGSETTTPTMTPMIGSLGGGDGVGTPQAKVVVKHSAGGTATTVSSLLPSSIIKTEVKTEIKTEPEEAIVINSDSDSEHAQRPSKPSTPGPVNVNVNVNLNFQEVPAGFDFLMQGRASSTSSQQGDGKGSLTPSVNVRVYSSCTFDLF